MSGCPFKSFFTAFQENSKLSETDSKQSGTNLFLDYALAKCPFLHNVEVKQGYEKAFQFLSSPWKPRTSSSSSEQSTFLTAFQTFHGESGVVPLGASNILTPTTVTDTFGGRGVDKAKPNAAPTSVVIPQTVNTGLHSVSPSLKISVKLRKKRSVKQNQSIYYGSNFASLSLSGSWGFFKLGQMKKLRKKIKSKGKGKTGKSNSNSAQQSKSRSVSNSTNSSSCPMRSVLGPMAGIVFNEAGKLACPAPIVAMRASLAKTTFIKQLRPKSVPTKLATIGGIGVLANIPCGMIREHYKKFSAGWFVAVHATIPFVAMLRKAAILPKYALGVTIIAAVVGQAIGAKMEKQRILEGKSWVNIGLGETLDQTESDPCAYQQEIKVMS